VTLLFKTSFISRSLNQKKLQFKGQPIKLLFATSIKDSRLAEILQFQIFIIIFRFSPSSQISFIFIRRLLFYRADSPPMEEELTKADETAHTAPLMVRTTNITTHAIHPIFVGVYNLRLRIFP